MTAIITQKQARAIRNLNFCYLCGRGLEDGEKPTEDHVPPECMFLKEDHDFPIIMMVHPKCNADWSVNDERVGFLISLLQGKDISTHSSKFKLAIASDKNNQSRFPLLGGIPLKPMICRIVRAFHAALYQEYLPLETRNSILTPIPEAEFIDGHVRVKAVLPQFRVFSDALRKNMATKTTDRIYANNGKLRYECCWIKSDDGKQNICVFGLRIYDWSKLGDEISPEEYACLGAYMPTSRPRLSTKGSGLHISLPKNITLDPFAC